MWWRNKVFYQIYIPSFKSVSGRAAGTIRGVLSELSYLQDLGIGAIWLTPFYQSPMIDNGYDISSYTDINPLFGDLDDFDALINEAGKREIKIVADMVLNHTSTLHPWFQESRSSVGSPKRDWYNWRVTPPNNWDSFFGGSAWEPDPVSGEYYYHAFHRGMADLNWDNPEVVEAMHEVLRFWLDRGVDGFRLDVINFLKTGTAWEIPNPCHDGVQEHLADMNSAGVRNAICGLRGVADEYKDIFLLGEVGSEDPEILSGYVGDGLLDSVFNFNLGSIKTLDFGKISDELISMNELFDKPLNLPTLFFSSHDMSRFFSRLCGGDGLSYRALLTVILTGRGVPFLYQGDEVGIADYHPETAGDFFDIKAVQIYQKSIGEGKTESEAFDDALFECRDFSRNLYLAESRAFAGRAAERVPSMPPYGEDEIVRQLADENSSLSWCRKLIKLRTENRVFSEGRYQCHSASGKVLIFSRLLGNEHWIAAINTGSESVPFTETMEAVTLLETGSDEVISEAYGTVVPVAELPGKTIQIFKVNN